MLEIYVSEHVFLKKNNATSPGPPSDGAAATPPYTLHMLQHPDGSPAFGKPRAERNVSGASAVRKRSHTLMRGRGVGCRPTVRSPLWFS